MDILISQNSKLSKLLLFLFFSGIFISSNAQNSKSPECGTIISQKDIDFWNARKNGFQEFEKQFIDDFYLQNRNGGTPLNSIPIQVHIIRRTDGTGGLSVANLNTALTTLNNYFLNAGMVFFQCGPVNYVDVDSLYNFTTTQESVIGASEDVANVINLYFAGSLSTSSGGGLCGYAYFPGGPNRIFMANGCTNNGSTLTHEFGHFFALYHTHGKTNCGNMTTELVDGSNCATDGDDVCDTPADPNLRTPNSCGAFLVNNACVYTGNLTDANGQMFMPNTRNIMSYSRQSCRNEMSPGQYARMAFTAQTSRAYLACGALNADFTANNTQACTAPLNVNFTDNSTGATAWEWDFGDGSPISTTQNPTHNFTASGSYDICLIITDGSGNTVVRTKEDFIEIQSEILPHSEDFERFSVASNASSFGDGWTTFPSNTTNQYRWNVDENGTPSSQTGPLVDHTEQTNSGNYVFTESTGANTGDVAELISPCIDLSGATGFTILEFWYHMHGQHMGELHVDINPGTGWINDITPALVGEQQPSQNNPYLRRSVDISLFNSNNVQIRFRGIRGNGFRSDMAIDSFLVFESLTPLPIELLDFQGFKLSENKNILTWKTSSELNNAYFEIQRSIDGNPLEPIGQVQGIGNSNDIRLYDFIDDSAFEKTYFYRLKQVDFDGNFSFSNIIKISDEGENLEIVSLFPNPSKAVFQVELNVNLYNYQVEIFNNLGQKVLAETKSGNNFNLDLTAFPSGIYHLQIQHEDKIVNYKLIKE